MNRTILGRGEWTARLHAEVDRTLSSHGGLLLLGGEAGIGKTTLIGGVVDRARGGGAIAVVGTCSSSPAAPALWPWTQIVRALRRAVGADTFAAYAVEAGLEADRVTLVDGRDHAAQADLQFSLFDAVASLLTALAAERPLVLVLEDLHWADAGSLDLLDFVARHCWFEPILLVGTYRDTEVSDPTHPAHARVEGLLTQASVVQVPGLDEEAVGHLVRQVTGRDPGPENAADLRRRTGGNPFFIEQTARLWAGGHLTDTLPPGVVDAVRRRLEPLGADVLGLLRAAAVLEAPMPLTVLARVAHAAAEPSAGAAPGSGALASALSARLLRPWGEGRYGFVHDLVRETVLADLSEDVARRLHAGVVDLLPDAPDVVRPGDAAAHAVGAGDLVPRERTRELLLAASADADSRMSLEESIAHLRRAVEFSDDDDTRLLADLALTGALAFNAALHRRDDPDAEALTRAVLQRAAGASTPVAARVALELQGNPSVPARDVRDLMRRCLTAFSGETDDEDEAAPARTDVEMATSLAITLAKRARAAGDDETLIAVLSSHHQVQWRPGTAVERQELMEELRTAARRRGDHDTALFASSMLWVTLLELGDPAYEDAHRRFLQAARESDSPRFTAGAAADEAVIQIFRGRVREARLTLEEARSGIPEHDLYWWMISYLDWAVDRYAGSPRAAQESRPDLGGSEIDRHAIAALAACSVGDFGLALREIRQASGGEESSGSARHLPLPAVNDRVIALVAAGTGDPSVVAEARALLGHHRGTWSVDLYGVEIGGPVDYYLGRVELVAGAREHAAVLLADAVTSADAMGTPYWATLARLALLEALDPEDEAVAEVRERALADAEALDLPLVHRRVAEVLPERATAAGPTPVPATSSETRRPPSTDGARRGEFRREGGAWLVGLDRGPVPIADAKGIRDLHTLLSSPGVDVPSVRLLNPGGDPEADAAVRAGGDPVLDDTAREQYRARLTRLEEDLDAAGLDGDTGRRDTLLVEREALIRELRAATGLSGRPRRLGDNAEKARKAVSGRIRDSLRKLDDVAPELTAHLRESVSTGTSCRYDPRTPVTWRLH